MKYAILPCNGLDKAVGPLSREVALWLTAHEDGELICPVLLGNSPERYGRVLGELPLLVIDGCATQCASKLANRLQLKISRKVQVAEEAKRAGAAIGKSLAIGPGELKLVETLAAGLLAEEVPPAEAATANFALPQDYLEVEHDKFVFKIPAADFLFNENDVWVQLSTCGKRARIGISDFAAQQMTDITFFGPPTIGAEVDQFGELGYVESAKATLELGSVRFPGRVVAINTALSETPELINQDPYVQGWTAELELRDFSADRELLIDGPAYAVLVAKKAAESSVAEKSGIDKRRWKGRSSMSDNGQTEKLLVIPCSGVGKVQGLMSREAAYHVTDKLLPKEADTVCLALLVTGDSLDSTESPGEPLRSLWTAVRSCAHSKTSSCPVGKSPKAFACTM